ncbi:unnamed protein product [Lymnaea stagnalis]|uniref:Transmembrane protein 272-like n=1 Tax=Lymnaea stagnalis TaxID=6523 RepID=A0AAV2HRV7_LYMST
MASQKSDVEAPPQFSERDNVLTEDGLPNYSQATTFDSPPSYDSLFGRVKAAKQESTGIFSFLKTFFIIILSTIGFTIIIGILMAVPISMIVMGALYKDDCPIDHLIPIYLIVAGSFGCAKNLFSFIQRCRKSEAEREEDQKNVNPFETIVNCFLFAWFIAGCVFIYRIFDDVKFDNPSDPHYCHRTLYWYSFWITTAVYIIMGASCCCVCLVGCLAALFGNQE